MRTAIVLSVGALVVLGLGSADAHPRNYLNAKFVGDHVTSCQLEVETGFCLGGTIYPAGHVVGDTTTGTATLTVQDQVKSLVSALVRNAGDIPFCGQVTWAPNAGNPTIVFVDGVIFGTVLSPCGPGDFAAHLGVIDHI